MTNFEKEFVDENYNIHIQTEILNQNRHSIVFRTKDPDLAIKLFINEDGNVEVDELLFSKLKHFRLLPIPENINISIPLTLLKNNAGYVMPLLSEMVPFRNFWINEKSNINPNVQAIPFWLSDIPEKEAKKIVYYLQTGGLRRRLIALCKSATILARLHGNGLVYGDISPDNLFISEAIDEFSVWMTDADNIRFEMESNGSAVYTAEYGVSELVQGKDSEGFSSDCFAFAVLAFCLLSLNYPFILEKDIDDVDDTAANKYKEEKSFAGLFSLIDDVDANSTVSGLSRGIILTEKLKKLFEETFGAGRNSHWLRPTIYYWPEALAQAADKTIECPVCKMTYYYDFMHPETRDYNCPYCKTKRPKILVLESFRINDADEHTNNLCWQIVREIDYNVPIVIPARVFEEFTMTGSDNEEMMISVSEKGIHIKKSDISNIKISLAIDGVAQNKFIDFYSQFVIEKITHDNGFWMLSSSLDARLVHCYICGGC